MARVALVMMFHASARVTEGIGAHIKEGDERQPEVAALKVGEAAQQLQSYQISSITGQ